MAEPAYTRIADVLRSRIRSGELVAHRSLPPERDLCEDFGVSRMTARRALVLLEEEGLVYRDGNRGTFVSEPRIPLRLGSFSDEVRRLGYNPTANVVWAEYRIPEPEVAEALQVADGQRVIAIRRVRKVNGVAIAIETSYYAESLAPGFLDGNLDGSLWQELSERFGVLIAGTRAQMEVVVLPEDLATLLSVRRGAQGIQLTRNSTGVDGSPVEYAVDVYRADRVSLVIDRQFT